MGVKVEKAKAEQEAAEALARQEDIADPVEEEAPETPEEEVVEEVAVEPAQSKRKAAPRKRATRKPAAKKTPSQAKAKHHTPTARELKDQFIEATVQPTREAALVWADVVDVAKDGLSDVKDLAVGILSGFLGNKKRED